jgi:hypothetical protein
VGFDFGMKFRNFPYSWSAQHVGIWQNCRFEFREGYLVAAEGIIIICSRVGYKCSCIEHDH